MIIYEIARYYERYRNVFFIEMPCYIEVIKKLLLDKTAAAINRYRKHTFRFNIVSLKKENTCWPKSKF